MVKRGREGGQTGRQAGRQAGGREGIKESRNKVQQIPVIMLSMPASTYYSINIFYYTNETMLQLIKHVYMYVTKVGTRYKYTKPH